MVRSVAAVRTEQGALRVEFQLDVGILDPGRRVPDFEGKNVISPQSFLFVRRHLVIAPDCEGHHFTFPDSRTHTDAILREYRDLVPLGKELTSNHGQVFQRQKYRSVVAGIHDAGSEMTTLRKYIRCYKQTHYHECLRHTPYQPRRS